MYEITTLIMFRLAYPRYPIPPFLIKLIKFCHLPSILRTLYRISYNNNYTFYIVPVGSPQNITLLELTSSSMALSWLPPPISQQNGDIVLYTVEYYKTPLLTDKENIIWNDKNSKTKTSLRNTHKDILLLRGDLITNISQCVNTSSRNITLTNLSTDTAYTVQVFAWTINGRGPPSSPQVFKTASE